MLITVIKEYNSTLN